MVELFIFMWYIQFGNKNIFLGMKNGGTIDFHKMAETLFAWSKSWIEKTK